MGLKRCHFAASALIFLPENSEPTHIGCYVVQGDFGVASVAARNSRSSHTQSGKAFSGSTSNSFMARETSFLSTAPFCESA